MNRRGFLSFLGAAAANATLDQERLLWVPGRKVYSIPSPRVFTRMDEALRIINQMMDNWRNEALRKYFQESCEVGTGWMRLSLEHNRFDILCGMAPKYKARILS